MKKIFILTLILFSTILNAATVSTSKQTYSSSEKIQVNFSQMIGHNKDWIGIYAIGTSNDWDNVLRWSWTKDVDNGTISIKALKEGHYEVRAFYNNSYQVETKVSFEVNNENKQPVKLEIRTWSANGLDEAVLTYLNQDVNDPFPGQAGSTDWIAIYKKESSVAWKNVLRWSWIKDLPGNTPLDHHFRNIRNNLPVGNYEVRFFRDNSFIVDAKASFEVRDTNNIMGLFIHDDLFLYFEYAEPAPQKGAEEKPLDWIGIYKKEDSVAWSNVLKWKWLKDIRYNELVHIRGSGGGPDHLDAMVTNRFEDIKAGLLPGKYEARFFRNNSFSLDTSFEFTVD